MSGHRLGGDLVTTIHAHGIGAIDIRQVPARDAGEPAQSAWMIAGPSPEWHSASTPCATIDPDLWFTSSGGHPPPVVAPTCAACPFRRRCLADALAWGPEHGRWGGYSVRAIARMREMLGVTRDPAGRAVGRRARHEVHRARYEARLAESAAA